MPEQQGQEPTAADTTSQQDAAEAPVVEVATSENAQAPVEADKPPVPAPTPEAKVPEKVAHGDDLANLSPADLAKMVRDLRKESVRPDRCEDQGRPRRTGRPRAATRPRNGADQG